MRSEWRSEFVYDVGGVVLQQVWSAREERYRAPDDWRVIDRELQNIAKRRSELDVSEARFLRAAERQQVWKCLGLPSIIAYMELRLGYGPRTAKERLRVARELGELPRLEKALAHGELKHSAVRELTRVATAMTEQAWIDAARGKNLRQVEEMVSGREKGDLPETPPKPDVRLRPIMLEVSPAAYALYRETRAALCKETGKQLDDSDFLIALCRRALEPANGNGSKANYQIAVTICEKCDRGWQDGAGAVVELDRAAIEMAECDAQRIGSLQAKVPMRATQDITPRVRRFVWRRAHGRCQAPGCRSGRNLDIHHVCARADGGDHDPSNLVVLCSSCHLALHRGLLKITGAAPALVFTWLAVQAERARGELRETLLALGVKPEGIDDAVEAALTHVGTDASFGALLRDALARCEPIEASDAEAA
ncbi:MAG TPA: HNH endonuclease signature motif containing protein [Kofleriaceae bacterium]|nr:HNH endonuclease signature motif containing protein [Kofleriaceae bacterium]